MAEVAMVGANTVLGLAVVMDKAAEVVVAEEVGEVAVAEVLEACLVMVAVAEAEAARVLEACPVTVAAVAQDGRLVTVALGTGMEMEAVVAVVEDLISVCHIQVATIVTLLLYTPIIIIFLPVPVLLGQTTTKQQTNLLLPWLLNPIRLAVNGNALISAT
ncbi:unnamed protein product [Coffea canephora]|uniref:Uncharacterized protein n=1 Tax=Coffea canephora TaxID=49390 RepID=A0A068TW23_COFCA|nr:unnamed protein product [Coffea canephora]